MCERDNYELVCTNKLVASVSVRFVPPLGIVIYACTMHVLNDWNLFLEWLISTQLHSSRVIANAWEQRSSGQNVRCIMWETKEHKIRGLDTVQKPPDKVFLIAHFSAWCSPRAMRIAWSGSRVLVSSNGARPLAQSCAPNPRRVINFIRKINDSFLVSVFFS